jgi:HEPN domain-containing protein
MTEPERTHALQRFSEWQRYAKDDEELIEITLRENGPVNPICFHAQQIAEKYLKGFLAYHKQPPIKSHNLQHLVTECSSLDATFSHLNDKVALLSAYYTETRYPGDLPEFTHEEAAKAYGLRCILRILCLAKFRRKSSFHYLLVSCTISAALVS